MAPDERLVPTGWGWTAALDARPGDLVSADGMPVQVAARRTAGERVELFLRSDAGPDPGWASVGVGDSVWGAEPHHAVCGGCGGVWPCAGHAAAVRARVVGHPVAGRVGAALRLVR